MDFDSSSKFITSLAKFLQTLCNAHVEFDKHVEVEGSISLNIDSDVGQKVEYVVNEKVCKKDSFVILISNSFQSQPARKAKTPKKGAADSNDEQNDGPLIADGPGQTVPNSTNVGTIEPHKVPTRRNQESPYSPGSKRPGSPLCKINTSRCFKRNGGAPDAPQPMDHQDSGGQGKTKSSDLPPDLPPDLSPDQCIMKRSEVISILGITGRSDNPPNLGEIGRLEVPPSPKTDSAATASDTDSCDSSNVFLPGGNEDHSYFNSIKPEKIFSQEVKQRPHVNPDIHFGVVKKEETLADQQSIRADSGNSQTSGLRDPEQHLTFLRNMQEAHAAYKTLNDCDKELFDKSVGELFDHTRDEETAIAFLGENGLLQTKPPKCGSCYRTMTLVKTGRVETKIWRCPRHKNIKASLRKHSFWERSHLDFRTIVELLFLWAHKMPHLQARKVTGLSEHAVMQWYACFREVCSWTLSMNPYQIGGPGFVVELDESLMAKRKDNDGQVVEQRCVLGGYCPETRQGFLQLIADKTEATLLHLVEARIAPGSIIHTKRSPAYSNIPGLPVTPPYQHLAVIHDPTSHLKRYWKSCEKRFKEMCGVPTNTLAGHLNEFVWREFYGKTNTDALRNIMEQLSIRHPLL